MRCDACAAPRLEFCANCGKIFNATNFRRRLVPGNPGPVWLCEPCVKSYRAIGLDLPQEDPAP